MTIPQPKSSSWYHLIGTERFSVQLVFVFHIFLKIIFSCIHCLLFGWVGIEVMGIKSLFEGLIQIASVSYHINENANFLGKKSN